MKKEQDNNLIDYNKLYNEIYHKVMKQLNEKQNNQNLNALLDPEIKNEVKKINQKCEYCLFKDVNITLTENDLNKYFLMKITGKTKAKEQLESDPKITDLLAVNMQTIELRQQGQATQRVTMIIPETSKGLSPFIHLISLKGRNMELNDSGIVLTQKAAELFDVSEGDRLSLYTDDVKFQVEAMRQETAVG